MIKYLRNYYCAAIKNQKYNLHHTHVSFKRQTRISHYAAFAVSAPWQPRNCLLLGNILSLFTDVIFYF